MRKEEWDARLNETLREYERSPFSWRDNCGLFAARCVDAMTGSYWAEELEQLLGDARAAVRFLRNEGGLEAAVTRRLGLPIVGRCPPRGSVCELPGRALGICTGRHVRVTGTDGLHSRELGLVLRYWPVQ